MKKVRFILIPTIFLIEKVERKGEWELYAINRCHFNRRIKNIENQIGWCFESVHRQKIFNQSVINHHRM